MRLKRFLASLLVIMAVIVSVFAFGLRVLAQPASIAEGFKTSDNNIAAGAIVSIDPAKTDTVKLADLQNSSHLVGVVSTDAIINVSATSKQVQVVTSGLANILVSDINGSIHTGDKITASIISGVGMAATSATQVLGTAQADFNTAQAQTQDITDQNGQKRQVHIGLLLADINPSYYVAPSSAFLPPVIQGLANAIAGHPVSIIRIVLAAILVLIALVSSSILLYTSIRSGITAIGRNPLATGSVRRNIIQVALIAAAIWIVGLTAAYLILLL